MSAVKRPIALLLAIPLLVLSFGVAIHVDGQQPPPPAPPVPPPDGVVQPIVTVDGPTRSSGTFMVVVRADVAAKVTWRNSFPASTRPIELRLQDQVTGTGAAARTYACTMLWFQEPASGPYLFRGRAQIETPTLDPVEDFEQLVIVGAPPAPTPVPIPPGPDPAPQPPPGGLLSKAYFILLDNWRARDKSDDLRSLGPEAPEWAAIRKAGHAVTNFDVEDKTAKQVYAAEINKAPVLLIFDGANKNKFVGERPIKSIADVRAVVKEFTGAVIQ